MTSSELGKQQAALALQVYDILKEQPDAVRVNGDKVAIIDYKFNGNAQPLPRIDRVSMVTASDDLGSYRTKAFPSTRTKAKRKAQRLARKKNRRHK